MKHEDLIFQLNEQIDYFDKICENIHKEMKELQEDLMRCRAQQDTLRDAIKALKQTT